MTGPTWILCCILGGLGVRLLSVKIRVDYQLLAWSSRWLLKRLVSESGLHLLAVLVRIASFVGWLSICSRTRGSSVFLKILRLLLGLSLLFHEPGVDQRLLFVGRGVGLRLLICLNEVRSSIWCVTWSHKATRLRRILCILRATRRHQFLLLTVIVDHHLLLLLLLLL